MYEYIFILIPVAGLDLPADALPVPSKDGNSSSAAREQITKALNGTSLAGFTVADNTTYDNHVRLVGDMFHLRVALSLDPRTGAMRGAKYAKMAATVSVRCWVSVDRARPDRLSCGIWNDGEAQTVGVEITNDPSKDDANRMSIYVIAPDIASAQEALLQTLRGEKRPEKPWIV